MKEIAVSIYALLRSLGGFGLLTFAALDSSILFLPMGQDLLLIAMAAPRRHLAFYYAAMATAGSVIGTLVTDTLSRKGGEAGLERRLPPRRFAYVKRKIEEKGSWALAMAALMPPPFPFTLTVAAAAALQFPRRKLLGIVAGMRMVRFSLIALLTVIFGRQLVALGQSPVVWFGTVGLLVLFIAGSVVSVLHWVRRSRRAGRAVPSKA